MCTTTTAIETCLGHVKTFPLDECIQWPISGGNDIFLNICAVHCTDKASTPTSKCNARNVGLECRRPQHCICSYASDAMLAHMFELSPGGLRFPKIQSDRC